MGRSLHEITHDGQQFMLFRFLFLITESLKSVEGLLKLYFGAMQSPLFQPIMEGVSPGMLTEYHAATAATDVLRSHDFVGQWMHEHPVLMNTRLMGKSIRPDHRFIPLHLQACDP